VKANHKNCDFSPDKIKKVTSAYLEHIEELIEKYTEELVRIIPNGSSLPDSASSNKSNHKEWKHIKSQITNTNNQTYNGLIFLKFKPKYWSRELEKKTKIILSSKDEKKNHNQSTVKFADAEKNYTLSKIGTTIYQIQKISSPTIIPKEVVEVLELGLNFVPKLPEYPLSDINQDLEKFNHKLRWNYFWNTNKKQKEQIIKDILPLKLRQNIPPNLPPNVNWINGFTDHILNKLTQKNPNKPTDRQLSLKINKTIKFLKNESNKSIIKPADKGGSIVLLDKDFYKNSIDNMLQQSKVFYQPIPKDPTERIFNVVSQTLKKLFDSGDLPKKLLNMLQPKIDTIRCPYLYGLPKIHKEIVSFRPIVSGNNHPTELVSIFLDYLLQPFSTSMDYYLKDSTQLLLELNNLKQLDPNKHILFSLDVVNMYPNIPLDELFQSIEKELNSKPDLLKRQNFTYKTKVILILLNITLFNNCFQFDGKFYHQRHGIAMGTPCACTISDIFICNFMGNAIKDQILKPLYYKQYRDDGFGIWEHGLEKLQEFCNQLNKIHPKIQFTLTTTKTLSYLDLNLEITPFGTISSETAYKSTETFNYLHYDSNHPAHTRNNIALSQAIRHIRNCTSPSAQKLHLELLRYNLIKRNHPEQKIESKFRIARTKQRYELLKYKKRSKLKRTPLILTYNETMPKINKIMDNACKNLTKEQLDSIGGRPLIGYRITKSIGQKIIRANQ